jgi:hypothetical protein
MPGKHTVRTADLHQIGSIDLTDIDILSKSYGRDFLPYPFMRTRPSRFSTHHEYVNYASSVPDRFNHGDLRTFRRWAASYAHADIRVECHVQYIPANTPSVRVVAHRAGELGYLAKQRPDEDVIDVFELSPYDLGSAVADSVDLTKPGSRSEIVIPEYVPSTVNTDAAEDFTVLDSVDISTATEVARAEVTAFAHAQSHWRPTRRWGFDRRKNAAVWVRIKDDGEYLFAADFREARPMIRPVLAERIDKLIAADIKVLRDFRNR